MSPALLSALNLISHKKKEPSESKTALHGLSWRQAGVYSQLSEGQKTNSGEELAAQLRELTRRFEYERLAELFESGGKRTT